MTSSQNAPAKAAFRPIYVATVIPGEIVEAIGKNGKPYLKITEAVVKTKKKDMTRTMMAFGKCVDEVRGKIFPGEPIELAIQRDGGRMTLIGLPRSKPANDEGLGGIADAA